MVDMDITRRDLISGAIGGSIATLVAVAAIYATRPGKEDSNIIYKGELFGSQVTYELVNDETHKLTVERDGLTWILEDDGDKYPEVATRIQGASKSVFDNDTGVAVPKQARDLYNKFVGAIDEKIDGELKGLGTAPVTPDPVTPSPAPVDPVTPTITPVIPTPSPAPANPATPTSGATSAAYARTHYRRT